MTVEMIPVALWFLLVACVIGYCIGYHRGVDKAPGWGEGFDNGWSRGFDRGMKYAREAGNKNPFECLQEALKGLNEASNQILSQNGGKKDDPA